MEELKELSVLYVDDDEAIRQTLGSTLEILFKKCTICVNGHEAFTLFHTKAPDIVIIDIEMPILDGIGLANKIRAHSTTTPIIVITGHDEKVYLHSLLTLGICAYLVKPITTFQLKEALLKASSLLKNHKNQATVLPSGYIYNAHSSTVTYGNTTEILSISEKKLLDYFLEHRSVALKHGALISLIWPHKETEGSALRQLIKALRKKVGDDSIKTVHGTGYIMM